MSWLIPLLLGGGSFLASQGKQQTPQATQYSTMSPQQEQFQNKILELLSGQLGENGGEDFESFAAPFRREFNEQTVPGIAERFAGLGGLSSSGFQQSLGQAGAGLNEKLASLQSGLKQQRFNSLLPVATQQGRHTDIEKDSNQNWLAELLGPILKGYGGNLANTDFSTFFSNPFKAKTPSTATPGGM